MNFLSHFYHELPCNDPYFAAGVILPDILSNHSYRTGEVIKLFPEKIEDSDLVEISSLIKGVKKHYQVDAYFHESEYFKKNTDSITAVLKKNNINSFEKRLYAISHVLLEIMLDRKILIEDRGCCDLLYSLLEEVDTDYIATLMKTNTKASDPASVAKHFAGFRAARFLYEYTSDERLADLINNLSHRLGNKHFSPTDRDQFKFAIYDIENAILKQKFPKFPVDSRI